MAYIILNKDSDTMWWVDPGKGLPGEYLFSLEEAMNACMLALYVDVEHFREQTSVALHTLSDGTPSVLLYDDESELSDRTYDDQTPTIIGTFPKHEIWELVEAYARML